MGKKQLSSQQYQQVCIFEPHLPKLATLPSKQIINSPICNPRGKVLRAAKVHSQLKSGGAKSCDWGQEMNAMGESQRNENEKCREQLINNPRLVFPLETHKSSVFHLIKFTEDTRTWLPRGRIAANYKQVALQDHTMSWMSLRVELFQVPWPSL